MQRYGRVLKKTVLDLVDRKHMDKWVGAQLDGFGVGTRCTLCLCHPSALLRTRFTLVQVRQRCHLAALQLCCRDHASLTPLRPCTPAQVRQASVLVLGPAHPAGAGGGRPGCSAGGSRPGGATGARDSPGPADKEVRAPAGGAEGRGRGHGVAHQSVRAVCEVGGRRAPGQFSVSREYEQGAVVG